MSYGEHLYRPNAWHWYLETTGRYWSSAARAYQIEQPENFTHVRSETDLRETLARAGFAHLAPGWSPTADDVRAEASRRMQIAFGARDAKHLEMVIANANREAIRLLRLGAANWSTEEAIRAAQLEGADKLLEAIRAASNALEPLDPIPDDYADDKRWP